MFKSRKAAGRMLVHRFGELISRFSDIVVIALPRPGLPVAFELARGIDAPLDVFSMKNIYSPRNVELSLGAVSEDGESFLFEDLLVHFRLRPQEAEELVSKTKKEARLQAQRLRAGSKRVSLKNKNIILVNDGVSTGRDILPALNLLRKHNSRSVMLATPVCSYSTYREISFYFDECFTLDTPEYFYSVGSHYIEFPPVTTNDAAGILKDFSIYKNPTREYYGRSS